MAFNEEIFKQMYQQEQQPQVKQVMENIAQNQPWYRTKGGVAGISGLASGIMAGLLGADVPESLAYGIQGASKGLDENLRQQRINTMDQERLRRNKAQEDLMGQRLEMSRQQQMQDVLNRQETQKQNQIANVQKAIQGGMLSAEAGNQYLKGLGIESYPMQQPQQEQTRLQAVNLGNQIAMTNPYTGEVVSKLDVAQDPTKTTQQRLQALNLGNRQVMVNPLTGEEVSSFDIAQNQQQGTSPSSVREYQFFNSLSPEEQQTYLNMKRSSQIMNLGGQQAVYNPLTGGIQESFAVTPKPEQIPEFKREQAYQTGLGKKQAEKQAKDIEKIQTSETLTGNIDNLINEIDKNRNLVGVYAPAQQNIGQITGGTLGFNNEELQKRGELVRFLGQIQNDLIVKARASGQSGINTLAEIQQATKGLDENSSAEMLIGALNAMKKSEQDLNNRLKNATMSQPMSVGRFKIRVK